MATVGRLPWQCEGEWIGDADGETIAYVDHHRNRRPTPYAERIALAHLIVAAVNAYVPPLSEADLCPYCYQTTHALGCPLHPES